uniref:Uncharacterized protein n=1 Tax=Ciona savignyi TaxID=51511 RepID=H2YD41_CIOSA
MKGVVLCFVILGLTVVLADHHRPILAHLKARLGMTHSCIDGCKTECAPLATCAKRTCLRTCRTNRRAGEDNKHCMMKCVFKTCLNQTPACKTCSAPCMQRVRSCKFAHCAAECPAGQTVPQHLSSVPCRTCVLGNCFQGNTNA